MCHWCSARSSPRGGLDREGLSLKPDSYSGSNTDGLTVKLLKTSCCFCAAVLIETVVKLGKPTYEDPGRWRVHPAAEIDGRRIQRQHGFITAWSESVPLSFRVRNRPSPRFAPGGTLSGTDVCLCAVTLRLGSIINSGWRRRPSVGRTEQRGCLRPRLTSFPQIVLTCI